MRWCPWWTDPHRLSGRMGNEADAGGPHAEAIAVEVGWRRAATARDGATRRTGSGCERRCYWGGGKGMLCTAGMQSRRPLMQSLSCWFLGSPGNHLHCKTLADVSPLAAGSAGPRILIL